MKSVRLLCLPHILRALPSGCLGRLGPTAGGYGKAKSFLSGLFGFLEYYKSLFFKKV
jgi:hypothetical protein